MSVSLTPVTGAGNDVQIPNREWLALTRLAHAFGEKVEPWNQCHDPKTYTPQELRAIAYRVRQIEDADIWLEKLA